MAGVGRDFWRSSDLTSLLKQGHLQPVARDHVVTISEDLQRERLHNQTPLLRIKSGYHLLTVLLSNC